MASMLQQVARRTGMAVKSTSPEAWETTSQLRSQYLYTTMEAMPARVAEASKEWAEVRAKIVKRDFTLNDIGVGTIRAVEFYCFYLLGRAMGSRSLSA